MPDEILVSVAIPTYNHEKYIEQCLLSILAQKTNFNFEIIVGDDYSTDGTRQKIIALGNQYPGRFKLLLHEKNLGPKEYPGRNNSIAIMTATRGKYVAFCEGDDYWMDEFKLQKQVDFMEANPDVVLCYGSGYSLNVNDNSKLPLYPSEKKQIRYTLADMVSYNHVLTLTAMYRNGTYAKNVPHQYIIGPLGDWILWCHLAKVGDIVFLNELFACHIEHPEGIYSGISVLHRLRKTIATRLLINNLTKGVYKDKIYNDVYNDLLTHYRKYAEENVEVKRYVWRQLCRFSIVNAVIRKKYFENFIIPFFKSRIRVFQ